MPNNEKNITFSREPRENKPFFKTKKTVLILSILLITTLLYQIKPAHSRTIHVPTEYSTIQAAVNAAAAGDTIQVAPRTYYEHVDVPKTLTIIGENPQTTIVDGTSNGTVFYLQASNIYLTGFTIRNAGDNYNAITSERELVADDYHQIRNNIITTSGNGIYLTKSNYNTIFNNTFINNSFVGIYVSNSDNTNITRNTITESAYGIKLTSSLNNIIKENTISQISFAIHLTSASTGNTISRNILYGKTAGVYSSSDTTTVDHNTIIDGSSGIYFYNCRYGSIYYNTITNSSYGIRLYWASAATSSHNVNNNKIVKADWAIELVNSNGNTFTGNWLQQNTYGIYMSFASSNTIYRNNFVQNNMQASTGTGTGNQWNQTGNGNYWSDYKGQDANHDGIGDTAYRLYPTGYDYYPLMTTWSEHDIEIKSVTASTNEANVGATVDITVTVKNRANISTSETFTVTAYNSTTPFATKTISWEYIYRDVDNSGTVSIGDIRLIAIEGYPAGSTVASGNTDIGQSLVVFASNEKHRENVADNNLYNPGEYIYRDVDTNGKVSINDVRLTAVGSYLAGSVVASGNTDINQNLIAFASNEKHRENVKVNNRYEPGLEAGTTMTLTFNWNTTGVAPGNYTIKAEASTVPDELNTDNNNYTDGTIKIKIPFIGDVNFDGAVNEQDLVLLNQAFGSTGGPSPSANWNLNADLNKDNIIDVQDLLLLGENYGKTN